VASTGRLIARAFGFRLSFILQDARITEHLGWMAEVVSRNLVLTLVVYQTWHHLLYVRDPPLSDAKINPRFPSTTQHLQCAGLTLLGSVVASCYEIAFVHAWAAGGVTYVASLFASPVGVPILLLQLAVSAYVADSHFYGKLGLSMVNRLAGTSVRLWSEPKLLRDNAWVYGFSPGCVVAKPGQGPIIFNFYAPLHRPMAADLWEFQLFTGLCTPGGALDRTIRAP